MSIKFTHTVSYIFLGLVLAVFLFVVYHMALLLSQQLPNIFILNFGGR
ncbi:hypothetical protein [Schleiferilactobacillus perolens]|jgi:hypothetical protein|nr:hypothetical protein [Schleiferilactobacillus perolens]MCI1913080.1 hypothetical protein [Schleiferilactobacillus harbinensis]MCI2172467.1 hypothetical protein [Schleiferilactobacillus perolens]